MYKNKEFLHKLVKKRLSLFLMFEVAQSVKQNVTLNASI